VNLTPLFLLFGFGATFENRVDFPVKLRQLQTTMLVDHLGNYTFGSCGFFHTLFRMKIGGMAAILQKYVSSTRNEHNKM
jgi:hypothetical protein